MKKMMTIKTGSLWTWLVKEFLLVVLVLLGGLPLQAEEPSSTGRNKNGDENQTSYLTEIIVTGEKTDRTLRETSSSVMVVEKDDLPAVNTSNDMLIHVPNIVTVEPGNDAPAVRGLDGTGPASGANAFLAGTRPRLNYRIDGRTLGFNEALFQDSALWDVSQVEVYRGPQSTQQGRNSIAGAVVVRTADPTFEWEGKIRALAGSYEKRGGSFMISGPIIDDHLAFRLATDYQSHKSAVEFTPYEQEDDPDLYLNQMVRGKLLYTPAEKISVLLTFGRTDGRAPQSERVIRPFEDREAEFPNQPTFHSINDYAILDTNWVISDNMKVEVNLSTTDFQTERNSPTSTGNLEINGSEVVFQPLVRLNTSDNNLSGFVGAYVFRTSQDEEIDLVNGGAYRDETETNALFSEISWWFSDQHNLTVGARYETEERYRTGSCSLSGTPIMVLDYNETYDVFLPKATLSWEAHDNWTVGVTMGKGYNGGGAGITFSYPYVAYTYDPEFVNNYEGFIRSSLMDGKLTLIGNLFYNDFKDMQLPFSLSANSTVIRNADKASTYGLEIGAIHQFSPDNKIFANLGVLKTRVDRYDDPTVEGNELARSPAFSIDLGFVVMPFPKFKINADLLYTDAYYSDATNTPRGKIDPYGVANAQMEYKLGSARFYFSVKNLFDDDSEVSIITGTTADADSATLLQPRTVTAGVEYSFL